MLIVETSEDSHTVTQSHTPKAVKHRDRAAQHGGIGPGRGVLV